MKRVLLADDEHASSEIIRYYIQKHNLPLEIVGESVRGDETLAAIHRLHPDIVFLDIEMPVMNGLQVMDAVNKEYTGDISFILITAYDSFEYVQQALRLGAKDFLIKPILYEQFQEMLQRVLGYNYYLNPLLNQVLEYLSEHYSEEVSLKDCATVLSASEGYISRLLRNNTGKTFTSYVNHLRIEKAKELLHQGVAVKTVAAKVGYNNLHYFYRVFKKETGYTPKGY